MPPIASGAPPLRRSVRPLPARPPTVPPTVYVAGAAIFGSRHQRVSEPVSPLALSLTLSVQVPANVWPANALSSGLFGRNVPPMPGAEPAQAFSTGLAAASSSTTSMFGVPQPNVVAGTPGRSIASTLVPLRLSVNLRSPG